MPIYHNRVKETTTSIGTGDMTLLGAVTQFSTFTARYAINEVFTYCIEGQTGGEWEVGYGWLSSSTVLVRLTVLQSSNSDTPVSFSAGIKNIFLTVDASKITSIGEAGSVVIDFGQAPGSNVATTSVSGLRGITPTANISLSMGNDVTPLASLVTPDGRTWSARTSPGLGAVQDIKFGAAIYVVLFKSAANVIATTTDFITYTPRTNGLGIGGYSLAFLNGLFIATGTAGSLCTSPDGINWTTQTSSFGTSIIYGVEWQYAANRQWYIAVGAGGKVAYSPAGAATWTQITTTTTSDITGIIVDPSYSGTACIVAAEKNYYISGATPTFSSFDVFTNPSSSIPGTIHSGGGVLKTYVNLNSPLIALSSSISVNSTLGVYTRPTNSTITSIVSVSGIWLALCSDGTMLRSLNGGQWYPHNKPIGVNPGSTGLIRHTNNTLFILTSSGGIYVSPNVNSGNTAHEHAVAPIKLTPSSVTTSAMTINAVSEDRLTGTYVVIWSWRS
jgi:hypothetical protein